MTDKPSYSDDDLLKIVREERRRSIGFGEADSGELTATRERALRYAKGDVFDVPALDMRSKAVDTTIADAIETVLPDVLEVFIGGDDVATFQPNGEEDEEAAQEESDFVKWVVFEQNPGFQILYTAFKDALLMRTGLFHWWWEDEEKTESKGEVAAEAAPMVQALGKQLGMELEAEEQEDGSYALSTSQWQGRVCIKAVPPEDFTVAFDTVSLSEATYCAMRSRPRVQDLIARGVDPEKARELPTYVIRNDAIVQERDEAGENNQRQDGTGDDLRVVEVREHYLRIDRDGDGQPELWRVLTNALETVLLEEEEVDALPFAAITPYIVAHRFYGESVADKLFEVQRIKTSLLRMALDSGYYALNQRLYVDMSAANEFTIPDLLNNQPGVPIRGRGPGGVTPLQGGQLGFDVFGALEYASTMAESRSGIVRNAQGLNPDTLHDTAQGAIQLILAAQKRVRMIARIFAETGVKDLFLGVHDMLRRGYSSEDKDYAPAKAKLRNQWKDIDPSQWQQRQAMTVHVGVGSAGKEHDLMVANQRLQIARELVMMPGAQGSLVDGSNIHNALMAWERATGTKNPDLYWTDPKTVPPQPPQPNPEMAKVQADMQLRQGQAQADAQLAAQKAQSDAALQAQKHTDQMQANEAQAVRDHQLKMAQIQSEGELKRYQISQELELKREAMAAELALKRELGMMQAHSQHAVGMAKVEASVNEPKPGGEPG